ncbi:M50 family metallopeptidase [Luteimonas sp. XNQY3]|nr:M50 family metallopeptidase [Luteimonas sp. XNQY3]
MPPAPEAPAAKPPLWRRALRLVVFFFAGVLVGVGIAKLGLPALEILPPGAGLPLLIAFFVSLWPHIVLHEAGHALAGLSRGMHAIAFGVGPFRIERGGDDRWRWRHGGGVRGISGFAALLPRDGRGLSRGDQAVFLLGGPLANLATAALCVALVAWLPMPAWLAGAGLGIAFAAAVMGLGNLLPMHLDGWRSDGRGLLDLARRTPDAALQLQINQLMALSLANVRPRDWPPASIPSLDTGVASTGLQQSARMLRLSHAIDRRDAGAARPEAEALAAAFANVPIAFRSAIAVTLASHAALLVGDRALLAAWRARCEGGLMDLSPYRAWLDAEIARLDGDAAAVRTHLDQARALSERIPDAASRTVFDERLAELHGWRGTAPAD